MKLCWLIANDSGGGIAPIALTCCLEATKAGHTVTMLMLRSPTVITSNDFRVASLDLSGDAIETPKILLEWLLKNPQDIVFFNGCSEFDPVIPYLPSNIKCVYVVHDTAPQYWRLALQEEENLDGIIAVSETVTNKFSHDLKQPQKLYMIHNGCIFPNLSEANVSRHNDLIFLGGSNPAKGAFDTLNVWKQLVKQKFTGKLHWFGNVTPEFAKKINQLPNSERIHVYGHISRDLIFSIATSVKVVLVLTRAESFGMATIEAMSMGCVPVAWDIETGTQEIVSANHTGLFAPLGNFQILAQQVLTACDNYSDFSAAVMERARSDFNAEMMWKGYEALIDHLCTLKPLVRTKNRQEPLAYTAPIHRFQLLPSPIRSIIREFVGRSPKIGYWLRDMRGW